MIVCMNEKKRKEKKIIIAMLVIMLPNNSIESSAYGLCWYLHRTVVPCSCRVVWQLYSVFYSVEVYWLAIDIDRLQVNRCLFHCCHLLIPFDGVSSEHIEFDPYDSHRCICVVPNPKQNHKSKENTKKITLTTKFRHLYVKIAKQSKNH